MNNKRTKILHPTISIQATVNTINKQWTLSPDHGCALRLLFYDLKTAKL